LDSLLEWAIHMTFGSSTTRLLSVRKAVVLDSHFSSAVTVRCSEQESLVSSLPKRWSMVLSPINPVTSAHRRNKMLLIVELGTGRWVCDLESWKNPASMAHSEGEVVFVGRDRDLLALCTEALVLVQPKAIAVLLAMVSR
jgi:hypothetical protein